MGELEAAKTRLQEQLAENPEPPAMRLHTGLTELIGKRSRTSRLHSPTLL